MRKSLLFCWLVVLFSACLLDLSESSRHTRLLQQIARSSIVRPMATKSSAPIAGGKSVMQAGNTEQLAKNGNHLPTSNVKEKEVKRFSANGASKKSMAEFQALFRTYTTLMNEPPSKHPFVTENEEVSQFLRDHSENVKIVVNKERPSTNIAQIDGDWSGKADGEKLAKFIGTIIEDKRIGGVWGRKEAKYSRNFFDKIIDIILSSEPGKVPPMVFETMPTVMPRKLKFVDEADEGSPFHVGLPEYGAKFECVFDRYHMADKPNWLGLTSFAEYVLRKEGTKGKFVIRLYYANIDDTNNGHEAVLKKGNHFVVFELDVIHSDDQTSSESSSSSSSADADKKSNKQQ